MLLMNQRRFLELIKNFPVGGSTEAMSSDSFIYTGSVTSGEELSLFSMTVLNAFSLMNRLDSGISICITLGFAWFFVCSIVSVGYHLTLGWLSHVLLSLWGLRHQDTTVCLVIYKGAWLFWVLLL